MNRTRASGIGMAGPGAAILNAANLLRVEPGVPIVMGLRGCKGPPVTVVHIRFWRLRCLAHVSYDPKSGHFLLTQNGHFCRRSGDLDLGIGQSPRKSG